MKVTACISVYVFFIIFMLGVSLIWQPAAFYINFVCYPIVNVRCGLITYLCLSWTAT